MIVWKTVLESLVRSSIYSLIIITIDAILIVFLIGGTNQITYTLSFVMFIEGGIGLIVGGAVALYSPSVAKIDEVLFHSNPWNAKRQKEIEKQMEVFIVTGIVLIIEALLLSAI
jgi:archaellum biogenesis protein FlaJ (TadC family)